MNRIKLSPGRRWGLYLSAAGLWLTGGAWLIAHYYLTKQGEYGPETSPIEPWALDIHGAFAFAGLWILGLLWGVHIVSGWHARRGRWSGGLMVGAMVVLTATGYLLYYLGDENARGWASLMHWGLGLPALPLFLWHRFVKKKLPGARKRARQRQDIAAF